MKSEKQIREKIKQIEGYSKEIRELYENDKTLDKNGLVRETIENGIMVGTLDWVLEDEE